MVCDRCQHDRRPSCYLGGASRLPIGYACRGHTQFVPDSLAAELSAMEQAAISLTEGTITPDNRTPAIGLTGNPLLQGLVDRVEIEFSRIKGPAQPF